MIGIFEEPICRRAHPGVGGWGLIGGSKRKASGMTDIKRKMKKVYHILVYLLIKENLYLKLYLFDSKIGINAFIREILCVGGLYERGLYAE